MRRAVFLAGLGLIVALAVAAGGGAHATKIVQITSGDLFTVAKSHVVCVATVGKKLLPGKKLLGCSLVKSGKIVTGSYSAAVTADGEAVLAKIKPDGSATAIIRRKPASAAASGARSYRLNVGDVAYLLGTRIFCIAGHTQVAAVTCAQYDVSRKRFSPGSYEVSIGDNEASLGKFDASGNVKLIKTVVQPGL